MADVAERDGRWLVDLPLDWMQGRTAYGGAGAALTVEAARRSLPGLPPLRAAQFAFVGPSSGRLTLIPTVLRRGRSVAFVSVDLLSETGEVATRALLCFGAARSSSLADSQPTMPVVPGPAACAALPLVSAPAYLSQFEIRPVGDGRVAGGGNKGELAGWYRHREAAQLDETVALVALGDASPPAPLAMMDRLVPVSTMTWSVEVGIDPGRGGADGWRYVELRGDMVAQGYGAERINVWSEDGTLLLTGRQSVAVFG